MADFATGTWQLVETENFDAYMKAVGVGLVMRKMAATIKPTQEITVENGRWKIKTISTLKTTEIDFVIGDVFEETTADGRKVQTVMSMDGQKLMATQKGDVDSTICREWSGDTMVMKLTAQDVVCTRTYKRSK
ncbi:sodium/calcium exchanger regulatory protein 1-like [Ruditapes philippinarum]|uniref:sodium/calcium exchanger regulatory protein 1-like n=1 Tax=Ruditapes philippinarum TaxID=129788 RepID=UPI00295BA5B6|nr:sodium/calcium exchanger regulatory protein 1-like [Ruditapes philippinarum]